MASRLYCWFTSVLLCFRTADDAYRAKSKFKAIQGDARCTMVQVSVASIIIVLRSKLPQSRI